MFHFRVVLCVWVDFVYTEANGVSNVSILCCVGVSHSNTSREAALFLNSNTIRKFENQDLLKNMQLVLRATLLDYQCSTDLDS